jgi:hypothetical protein
MNQCGYHKSEEIREAIMYAHRMSAIRMKPPKFSRTVQIIGRILKPATAKVASRENQREHGKEMLTSIQHA